MDVERETRIRNSAFVYLRARELATGGVIRYKDVDDFEFEGQRIPLMATQQGIRKPALLDAALSFKTAFALRPDQRPYADEEGPDGYLRYKWRGTDPNLAENRAMRTAMEHDLDLIWFVGYDRGVYLPVYPVRLVGEEPDQHQFVVAVDASQVTGWNVTDLAERRQLREYAERVVKVRVHQPVFRQRVLAAYESRCSICNLKHVELLDAAHVKGDADGGEPVVTNGIAMCKIHHSAFDATIMGIDPDYGVHIRADVLEEEDGPTLRHALQAVHGQNLQLPRRRAARPDRDLLAERFETFQAAS